jgi:hypothetical protein
LERGFLGFGENSAKERARSGLTPLREAHVKFGQLTCRAWEAKLSRNDAKTQKDRSLFPFDRTAKVFLEPL